MADATCGDNGATAELAAALGAGEETTSTASPTVSSGGYCPGFRARPTMAWPGGGTVDGPRSAGDSRLPGTRGTAKDRPNTDASDEARTGVRTESADS